MIILQKIVIVKSSNSSKKKIKKVADKECPKRHRYHERFYTSNEETEWCVFVYE